jgi:hypothetical protein
MAIRRAVRLSVFSRLEPEAFRPIGAIISSFGGAVILVISIKNQTIRPAESAV